MKKSQKKEAVFHLADAGQAADFLPIFLIGFMGSGKTFLGEKLTALLGWSFIDLDGVVERAAGKSIPEIFAENGEIAFRELEREALFSVFSLEKVVVATGGGTPCFFENMARMNAHGRTIYLKTPADLLARRLELQRASRPLLASLSAAELLPFIEKRLAERSPYYMQARWVIEQTDETAAVLAHEMAACLRI